MSHKVHEQTAGEAAIVPDQTGSSEDLMPNDDAEVVAGERTGPGAIASLEDVPHRRRNLLSGDWVLVSPHRARRPWQGGEEQSSRPSDRYSPACYLCPTNVRASGARNPDYSGPLVFDNDFAALKPESPSLSFDDPLRPGEVARGLARVICYSPDHSCTLPEMQHEDVLAIVDTWCAQSAELSQRFSGVVIFENKGEMMGCSSPHPHGQIWASEHVPDDLAVEDVRQAEWRAQHGTSLLQAVVVSELVQKVRLVEVNDHWVAFVPWWAAWPFETLLVARNGAGTLPELNGSQRAELADILRRLTARYDNLFGVSFPYSMGWHQRPSDSRDPEAWCLHAHFYPPLLRSATVRKFMVGYEMLAEPQRDITPEQAAKRLRAASPILHAVR